MFEWLKYFGKGFSNGLMFLQFNENDFPTMQEKYFPRLSFNLTIPHLIHQTRPPLAPRNVNHPAPN